MSDRSRREFLKRLLSSSGVLLLPACEVRPGERSGTDTGSRASSALDWGLLRTVARDVLPTELGPDGVTDVVRRFRQWVEDYQPGVERDHGYLTAELAYTPEDPAPRWAAQLRALDQSGPPAFAASAESERRRRLRAAVMAADDERSTQRGPAVAGEPSEPADSPILLSTADALRAPHVVVALLVFFFSSPQATDLCFRAQIGPQTCRDLARASERPA